MLLEQLRSAGAPEVPDPALLNPLARSYLRNRTACERDLLILHMAIRTCRIARRLASRHAPQLEDEAIGEGLLALTHLPDKYPGGDYLRWAEAGLTFRIRDFLRSWPIMACPARRVRERHAEGIEIPMWRPVQAEIVAPEAVNLHAFRDEDLPLVTRRLANVPVPQIAEELGWKPWRVRQRLKEIKREFSKNCA